RERYGASEHALPNDLLEAYVWYDWPGNVRQLENFVKRQLILPSEDAIFELRGATAKETALQSKPSSLREIGRRAAEQAEKSVACAILEQTGWNRKESARRLQISYKAFRNRIQKWQLSREGYPGGLRITSFKKEH